MTVEFNLLKYRAFVIYKDIIRSINKYIVKETKNQS